MFSLNSLGCWEETGRGGVDGFPGSVIFVLLKRRACVCAVLMDSEAQVVTQVALGPSADAFGFAW